ncbi:hypothetical protein [Micromonospora sp. WMMD812]|uniref:YncE family protein n=1 Tax=Micromonospora sp. WMMD812 TaxID=3015152 RepID=UPI00248D10D8|nr:hypothetical protein [Micromonospora sp. WMMD812]WBB68476.1 hypothetical protein O7603_03590 [Micromonospora sp. WMMD812]
MANISISRRTVLTALAGAGAAALVGCDAARRRTAAPAVAVPDPLLVELEGGLGVLRGAGRQTIPRSLATADGRAIYGTAAAGADTAFFRVDTATGHASRRVALPGRWTPQAVSADGTLVALTADEVGVTEGRPGGRAVTPVLIADAGGVRQRLELPGNFVPEAFTDDRGGLFVLEWLPPAAPDRYRVRVVDLATTAPGPLSTRAKVPVPPGAEEEMRGDGRQAVLAPDRTTLYTLYTHQDDHRHTRDLVSGRPGNVHAFVHTLNLVERWAYCVDLPHPFGAGPASCHTTAVTPDGRRLFVADVASGTVAEISAQELTVRRTATVASGAGLAHSAADHDRLFVGAGPTVRTVDLARLGVAAEWPVPERVTGLVLSRDGARLYVGQPGAVSWHDPATGAELGRAAVTGLVGLRGLAGTA